MAGTDLRQFEPQTLDSLIEGALTQGDQVDEAIYHLWWELRSRLTLADLAGLCRSKNIPIDELTKALENRAITIYDLERE